MLGGLDLTRGTVGHLSARIPGTERVFIRARGPAESGVRFTSAADVIEVDLDGKPVGQRAAGLEAPNEVFIHTEIYRARSDVNGIVHIHPPAPVLFTICNRPLLPIFGAFDPAALAICLEGIPTYERSITIRTPQLGVEFARVLGSKRVCLMRGHGITTAGPNIEEASLSAISLNDLATMNERAALLGNPQPISADDEAVFRQRVERPEAVGGGRPTGRAGASWRYYRALVGAADVKVR